MVATGGGTVVDPRNRWALYRGRVPVWLARLIAGEVAVMLGTESRGASNAKAKSQLGWTPRYPSWRQGFAEVYARADKPARTSIAVPARS